MQVNQNEVIDLLANHELAISKLYRTYARTFPSYEDFWSNLAAEETDHAKCILKIKAKALDGTISLTPDRFSTAAINRSLRYLEQANEAAADPGFSILNALSTASLVEDALLENKFFEIVQGDSPMLRQILDTLNQATQEHCQIVHQALSQEKQRTKIAD
jgi:hypothetical protein